ncbi:integrase core domain protein, partial [Gregarina niphandrodes]
AELFRDCWYRYFGAPLAVLVDGGTEFKGEFFDLVQKCWKCRLYVTAPSRPQGNGVNESSHRGISKALHGADVRSGSELREAVSSAVLAHNNIPHPATGLAPVMALIGADA